MPLVKQALGMTMCVALLSGCVTRITDFTVISTKNVNVAFAAKANTRVTGTDCVYVVLIPLGMPNLKEAIDRAIEGAGPQYDGLIDGVVYHKNMSFLFGKVCYEVEGTPVGTKGSGSAGNQEADATPILYHSRTGLVNDHSQIPVVEVLDDAVRPPR